MKFEDIFVQVKEGFMKADVSSFQKHLAFQFNITGEGGGTFYAEIKDGKIFVEPYDYKDRDVMFTASSDTFFKLIERKINPMIAYGTGKLKVEGDLGKALELQKLL